MIVEMVMDKDTGAVCWVRVSRGKGEAKIYSESAFWHKLKKVLNQEHGCNLVKRNMEQDGHMMGDKRTYYLRDRRWRFCLYDPNHMIRRVYEDFNEGGGVVVRLTMEHWEKNQWSGKQVMPNGTVKGGKGI